MNFAELTLDQKILLVEYHKIQHRPSLVEPTTRILHFFSLIADLRFDYIFFRC